MIGQLILNPETGRLEVDRNGDGLHSGQPLKVLVVDEVGAPRWIDTRLEYSKGWYLVGLQVEQVAGLFAQIP